MISLSIDNTKIKVKYLIGIYQDLPSYPDSEDLLYYLVNQAISNNNNQYEFSDLALLSKFKETKVKDIDDIQLLLKDLVSKKYVRKVKSTNLKDVYELIENPFV